MDNLKTFLFFQVDVIADLKVGDVIYSDIKQKNNDSVITPENWEAKKETFFEQRMETYKDSYSLIEKINLELKLIDEMQIETDDYTVIRERYRQYLMDWSNAKPTKQEEPVTFKSLFHDERMAPACIDVLKNCEPPLIDEDCNFIGNDSNTICVWVSEMKKQGLIKKPKSRKVYPDTISQVIKNFSLDESMFSEKRLHKRAEDDYREQFESKLKTIKQTQLSQKG
jgi:hypothetical protein